MKDLEITSGYNIFYRLRIEKNIAKLWQGDNYLSTIVIPENHCGCGYGPIPREHNKYPNNIKDFDFYKVISAIDFITWFGWKKTTRANKKYTSYAIKHMIERSVEYQNACKHNNVKSYTTLSNGELILAMQLLGFKIYPQSASQNVYFNIPDNCYLGREVVEKQIEVNSVREINDNQLEIIITGINELKNSYVREIVEKVFSIIKKGECDKCPVASPIDEHCVCYFQD